MANYSKVEDSNTIALVAKIINRFPEKFSHLDPEQIVLVFKDSEKSSWYGQTRLIKGVWQVITDKAVLMTLWKNAWNAKTPSWQALLIYHELLHIGWDDEKGYKLIKHDIEDFAEVLKQYGIDWENSDEFIAQLNKENGPSSNLEKEPEN